MLKLKKLLKNSKNNKGQGVMEYLIITSLIGIFCMVAVKSLGSSINTRVKNMTSQIEDNITPKYNSKK